MELKNLTEKQKSLLCYAYFKAKSAMIADGFSWINSSREKEDEIYRWRFAENKMLYHESDLLKFRLQYLQSEIEKYEKSGDKQKLEENIISFGATKEQLEKQLADNERIKTENEMFLTYEISFYDLDLDFDGIVDYLNKVSEDEKRKILAVYKGESKRFNIKINEESPASMQK